MNIQKYFVSVLAVSGALLGLGQAHAQGVGADREEVWVEWDFSKRAPINRNPFAKLTQDDASASAAGLGNPQGLAEKDQMEKAWAVQFSDATVRRMLQRWSDDAGYQLLWEVPRDYPIEVEMKLHGQFRDAVWTVARSLALTDAPIQVSINPDIRLVRVIRYLSGQAR